MDKTTKIKVMITCPRSNAGGVYNFVKNILPFMPHDVSVLYRGDPKWGSIEADINFSSIIRSLSSTLVSVFKLTYYHPDVILVNSSLSRGCMIRDGILIGLARLFCVRPILIIHGFQESALRYAWLLSQSYFRAETIFVLANSFAEKLENYGYKGRIIPHLNPVAHSLMEAFSAKKMDASMKTILFFGRVEESKGIFIALDTFRLLRVSNLDLVLLVVGQGSALCAAKEYVRTTGIKDVHFLGFLSGKEKENVFLKSDLLLFPSFNEGLPISVLEAMSAGLIVIARPVGGLVDLYSKIDFGGLTESTDPSDYVVIINRLYKENRIIERKMRNRKFALTNFHPQTVVDGIMKEVDCLS